MTNEVEIHDFYDRSLKYYLEAADKFPKDDEYYIGACFISYNSS